MSQLLCCLFHLSFETTIIVLLDKAELNAGLIVIIRLVSSHCITNFGMIVPTGIDEVSCVDAPCDLIIPLNNVDDTAPSPTSGDTTL